MRVKRVAKMMLILALIALMLAIFPVIKLYLSLQKKALTGHYPGPKGLPWIGSVYNMPIYGAVFQFKLWTDTFGPLAEATLLGQRVMFISSEKIAKDLLVANGQIMSGRPNTPAVKDAQSKHDTSEYLPLMSFNEDHRRHKKIGNRVMTRSQANNNRHIPLLEARRLMCQLSTESTGASHNWIRATEGYTSTVLSWLCFGDPKHAPYLHKLTWELLIWVSPNGVLPNLFPFLNKLPSSLSPWKALEWYRHRRQQNWFKELLEDTRRKMEAGEAPPSFMLDHLQALAGFGQNGEKSAPTSTYPTDDDAARAIGMIATAGIFTVSGPLQNVVRALVCFPEWQPRLQEEMDAVVPFPQVPTLEDLARLPLLRAFIRETTRWRQAIPSGIPHEAEADYEYNGVLITKGTAIFPLEYGMARDESVYPRPYDFDPMRWLDPASPNYIQPSDRNPTIIGTAMFGWGRRYCMGHELARDEIYAFASHIVWTYNLSTPDVKKLDSDLLPGEKRGGHQWPTKREQSLIIMRPEKIRVEFKPRHNDRLEAMRKSTLA